MGIQFGEFQYRNLLPLFRSTKIELLNDYVLYLKQFSSLQHFRGQVDIVFVVQQHYLQQLTLQPRGQQLRSLYTVDTVHLVLRPPPSFCHLPFLCIASTRKLHGEVSESKVAGWSRTATDCPLPDRTCWDILGHPGMSQTWRKCLVPES